MGWSQDAWDELAKRAVESKFGGIRADSSDELDDVDLREKLIKPKGSREGRSGAGPGGPGRVPGVGGTTPGGSGAGGPGTAGAPGRSPGIPGGPGGSGAGGTSPGVPVGPGAPGTGGGPGGGDSSYAVESGRLRTVAQEWGALSGTVDKTAHLEMPTRYGLIQDMGAASLGSGSSGWRGTAGKEFSTICDRLAHSATAYGDQETRNTYQARRIS